MLCHPMMTHTMTANLFVVSMSVKKLILAYVIANSSLYYCKLGYQSITF